MAVFTQVMDILQKGIGAFGIFWIIWGIIVLAGGIKDKTAPEIKQGAGQIIGGAMITLAAVLISQIKL